MSDVLSQAEIDALLAALASGEPIEEEGNTQSADETNAPSTLLEDSVKFADKDIEILQYIHKEYTDIICSTMFKNLDSKVSLVSVQEIRYEEFMRSIPCPTVVCAFKLDPLEGDLLFETSPSLAFHIADVFQNGHRRERTNLTEFCEEHKNIFMDISKKFIGYLEVAWNNVLETKAEADYLVTNSSEVKLGNKEESVALLSFSITLEGENYFFNICIPYNSIEKYSGKLEIKEVVSEVYINSTNYNEPNINISHSKLNNGFQSTNLNIKVILDNISLTLGAIKELKKGSIIDTHKVFNNKVSVLIEENHCFNGEVGLINNRKAVKIADCLEKDV